MTPRDGPGTRESILRQVRDRPGVHKSEICRILGLAWGTVTYHLRVLERGGQVRSIARGRQVNVFPAGVPEQHMRWLSALREDVGILSALSGDTEPRIGDLSAELGVPRRVIRRHLATLQEDGLVSQDEGRVRLAERGPPAPLELPSPAGRTSP